MTTLIHHVIKKTKSVLGEVEEGTGKEKIIIFITSKSHNKTALTQSSVLALLVKQNRYIVLLLWQYILAWWQNQPRKIFLKCSLPLCFTTCEDLFGFVVFFLFFLTKNWHKEMGWENATASFIHSSLLIQLWVLNSSDYIAFGLMFPKWTVSSAGCS